MCCARAEGDGIACAFVVIAPRYLQAACFSPGATASVSACAGRACMSDVWCPWNGQADQRGGAGRKVIAKIVLECGVKVSQCQQADKWPGTVQGAGGSSASSGVTLGQWPESACCPL